MAVYPNDNQKRVLASLTGAKQAKTVAKVAELQFAGVTGAARIIRNALRKLVIQGHVNNVSRGKYCITEDGEALFSGEESELQDGQLQLPGVEHV